MLKKLSSGYKIATPGLLSTLVLFFLPWVLTSCGSDPLKEYSGWQLAVGDSAAGKGYSGNIIVLLFLVASLVLLFFAFRSLQRSLLTIMDSFGVTIISIVVLLLLFQQFLTTPGEGINREILYGLWLYIVGWVIVLIGGVVNIMERKNQPPPDL
jgi:hypothetical protein